MTLIASASAATLVAPAAPIRAAVRTPLPKKPALPTGMVAEIEKQKKLVADALKVIREFPLPPGSDMAFAFRPLRPARKK
jgi:hypothetical protein